MDEEKAVLDFFSKPENLPLALSVAHQTDTLREEMNSNFWLDLKRRIDASHEYPEWETETIKDRDCPEILLGVRFRLTRTQPNFLFPMMEQQQIGGKWRIFTGLMWQESPSPAALSTLAVAELKKALETRGYRGNRNFLAWRWTDFYPRRKDFLLEYAMQPEKLLSDAESILDATGLLDLISEANTALAG